MLANVGSSGSHLSMASQVPSSSESPSRPNTELTTQQSFSQDLLVVASSPQSGSSTAPLVPLVSPLSPFRPTAESTPQRSFPKDLHIPVHSTIGSIASPLTAPPTPTLILASESSSIPPAAPQNIHPIDCLQTLLYEFSSSFQNEGVISTINALLGLPRLVSVPFYSGESATADGKCPFCAKKLR